ncbi:MAG: Cadherin, partial [Bacteroidota bacterium]|nr:Cadherin [Bacteroidota bacterium]
MKKLIFILYVALLFLPYMAQSRVIHVKGFPSGDQSGSSWSNSCTLAQAIGTDWGYRVGMGTYTYTHGFARCNDTLWIAQGGYSYFSNSDGSSSGFVFATGAYYGGFLGNETSLSQRNPSLYVTKITDEIGDYKNLIPNDNTSAMFISAITASN